MALSFPLPLTEFFDMVPVRRVTFRPDVAVTFSETGGGEVIAHQMGTRLWGGEIVLGQRYHQHLAAIEARIALLEQAAGSLFLSDPRLPGPIADPGASILGQASVEIAALDSNNREMSLRGLPPGYVISTGDLLSFTYGSNPVRHAFHRVVTGGAANGAGTTGMIEIIPWLRPGAAIGARVELARPFLKAKLVSAEYGAGRATISSGGKIAWRQTLR